MMKYIDEDPEYAESVRQLIVESDVQAFIDARRIVVGLRANYVPIYDFVYKNWDRLDRPVSGPHSFVMHG